MIQTWVDLNRMVILMIAFHAPHFIVYFIYIYIVYFLQVILDLLQFDNIAVRRVLNTEEELVSKMAVIDFPSCYLYYQRGNFSRLNV